MYLRVNYYSAPLVNRQGLFLFFSFKFIFTPVMHCCIMNQEVYTVSTEKPRFTVTVSDEMKKNIEDFFHSRKFKNQSQAVNQLIERGLDSFSDGIGNFHLDSEYAETKKSTVPEGTEDEFKVQEVVSGLTDILDRLGLIDASGDISAEDARVLAAFASGLCFYFRSRSDES